MPRLASARVMPVSVTGRSYELLAWGSSGWLCEPLLAFTSPWR